VGQQRPELQDGKRLLPQGDEGVVRIVFVRRTVIGDEQQQRVTGFELAAHPFEPAAELPSSCGLQRDPVPDGVGQVVAPQRPTDPRPRDQPEVGMRRTTDGQIGLRILAVRGEDVDALCVDPPVVQLLHHVLEMVQVAQRVVRRRVASVDQQGVSLWRARVFGSAAIQGGNGGASAVILCGAGDGRTAILCGSGGGNRHERDQQQARCDLRPSVGVCLFAHGLPASGIPARAAGRRVRSPSRLPGLGPRVERRSRAQSARSALSSARRSRSGTALNSSSTEA
jgi:hypothetical protein